MLLQDIHHCLEMLTTIAFAVNGVLIDFGINQVSTHLATRRKSKLESDSSILEASSTYPYLYLYNRRPDIIMTHIIGSQIGNFGRHDTGQNIDRQKRLTEGACRSEPLRSSFTLCILRALPNAVLKRKLTSWCSRLNTDLML